MLRKTKQADLSSVNLGEGLTTIVLQNYRKVPLLPKFRPAPQALNAFAKGCVEASMRQGICDPFYVDKKLKALFLLGHVQLVPGFPLYWGFVETDRSKESDKWLLDRLKKHLPFFEPSTMLEIPHYLQHLLPKFYSLGYFIDTVRTVGSPGVAYKRLMEARAPEDNLDRLGLSVSKLRSVAELRQVEEIERAEFKRNPQFGWFVNSEKFLDQMFEMRKNNANDPSSCLRVIKRGNEVLGYFGYNRQPGFFNGSTVGSDFVFHRRIQGKGISHVGYRILLEHMIQNKVDFFYGNTSQKPILKLAKIMGRVPQTYMIRAGKGAFSAKYFRY